MKTHNKKLGILLPLILVGCLVMLPACANVSYISRGELNKRAITGEPRSAAKRPKEKGLYEFGALHFKGEEGTNGQTVILKRKKSYYAAEALMVDHPGEDDSWFDRSYVSLGADHKKKTIGLQLRFVY
ncbi:MAG: hypothetical protein H6908_01595 [Hyphomicrobiales bacterium]|nr:hypothetical protein [Rickettsiales bacterium]MCP5361327.1 hypothetical protein [Hyphomicrobiales bacterium]